MQDDKTTPPTESVAGFFGIRARLILLVLVCWLPLAAALVWAALDARDIAIRNAVQELERASLSISDHLKDTQAMTEVFLVSLANSPRLYETSTETCDRTLQQLVNRYASFGNLFSAGTDGRVICTARPDSEQARYVNPEFFRRAVLDTAPHTGRAVSDHFGLGPVLPVSLSLRDDFGHVNGVVSAAIDLGRHLEVQARALALSDTVFTLWRDDGLVLARVPDTESLVGSRNDDSPLFRRLALEQVSHGAFKSAGLDGIARQYTFSSVDFGNNRIWITAGIDKSVLFGEVETLFSRTILTLLLVSLFSIALAWGIAEVSVRRPVSRLSRLARAVAQGRRDLRAPDPGRGAKEMRALTKAFNAMLDSLVAYEAESESISRQLTQAKHDLEIKVGERTAQLEQAGREAQEKTRILEEGRRESAILTRMTDMLQSCHMLEEAYPIIERFLAELFSGHAGALYIFRESGNVLEKAADWSDAQDFGGGFAPDDCWSLRLGQNYHHQARTNRPSCKHVAGHASDYCCIPMMAQGKALGVLTVAWTTAAIDAAGTEAPARMAERAANRVGLAIANVKLREALRNLSIRDTLTGLYNRRFLDEAFEREVARARRGTEPLSLLVVDVDHFKRFNDTYGHEAGDAVLRTMGQLLMKTFRQSDLPCRMGGEEFVVLLPGADTEAAMHKAQSLRETVKAIDLSHQGRNLGRITISIGVATFPSPFGDESQLFEAADKALYQAKQEGRDRVKAASRETLKVAASG